MLRRGPDRGRVRRRLVHVCVRSRGAGVARVRAIELRLVGIPLVRPFRTSIGVETEKVCVLARVVTDDAEGWGECVTGPDPGFSEEFNESAWVVIKEFLAPSLFRAGDIGPEDLDRVFAGTRGNPMAKATIVNAFLDAHLRHENQI